MITINPNLLAVPQVVDMAQARLALLDTGRLATVQAAIDAMPGLEGDAARIEWEFRTTVRRDSALVQSLIAGFGWSNAEVDAMFVLAASK